LEDAGICEYTSALQLVINAGMWGVAGVIHGDLKAANCMLTQSGDNEQGVWAAAYGHKVCASCLLTHSGLGKTAPLAWAECAG